MEQVDIQCPTSFPEEDVTTEVTKGNLKHDVYLEEHPWLSVHTVDQQTQQSTEQELYHPSAIFDQIIKQTGSNNHEDKSIRKKQWQL